MATLEQIVAGLIDFRDTTYAKLAELDAKVQSILDEQEPGVKLEMEFCALCQGTGYYTTIPSPGGGTQNLPCYICDRRGYKIARKHIVATKIDEEFPQK